MKRFIGSWKREKIEWQELKPKYPWLSWLGCRLMYLRKRNTHPNPEPFYSFGSYLINKAW